MNGWANRKSRVVPGGIILVVQCRFFWRERQAVP
jgi:hypothetical protein